MNRTRYKNIINKTSQQKANPFEYFKQSLPKELDSYKGEGYRLEAAWKAYGKPKDVNEAYINGLVDFIGSNPIMPSIGYNEETDSYEYLNTGKENEAVNRDIRVWDNDVIPFVKELKNGGYIRTFNEEQNCWMYQKGGKTEESPEQEYRNFLAALPENLRTETPDYNMKRYWELNGKPKTWFDALNKGMFSLERDGYWHSGSIAYNKDVDEYEFVKSPNHPTIQYELDWYNSPEGYEFAKKYQLIKPKDGSNYKYVRRKTESFKQGGQMNVIPDGALHAHKNHMEGAGEYITAKGIPVVTTDTEEQTAEIEREELILTKENTEKIEDLYRKFFDEETSESGKDELAIKAGKLLSKELIENTDDRTGLINKLQ